MLKDRVFVGFISGIIAAVVADIANWIIYYINFTDIRFLDWASIILLGQQAGGFFQIAIMQICQLVWDGVLGIVFSMIIPIIKSNGIIFKGILFSFMLLFIFRAVTVLFALQPLKVISFETFLSNVFCSIIWGILMAYSISKFHDMQNKSL